MEADWYIDPLGRYEGRFFDGARWTHQVSDRGTLAFDPDWPPVARGRSGSESTVPAATGAATVAGASTARTAQATTQTSSSAAAAAAASKTSTASTSTDRVSVEKSFADDVSGTVRTSSVAESPTRQVAVVNQDTRAASSTAAAKATTSTTSRVSDTSTSRRPAAPRAANASTRPAEPIVRDPFEREGSSRRWLYVLGGLLLLAGLALALLPRLFDGDDAAQDNSPAVEVVDDTAEADATATDTDTSGDALATDVGGEVVVGAVTIRNGQTLLGDLTTWHGEQAMARGIELPPDADCWFAKRGDVAEEAAFCGPVGVDDEGRTLYDQLAVAFDDAGPQVVSASVDRESLIPNVALDQGRELVDRDGEITVGGPTEPPKRGERIRE